MTQFVWVLLHITLCVASDMPGMSPDVNGMAEQVFGMQSPQVVSQVPPSELETLSSQPQFDPMSGQPQLDVNGLPFVSMDVAVNQFLQKEERQQTIADQSQALARMNLEEEEEEEVASKSKSHKALKPKKSLSSTSSFSDELKVHSSVPKLQQWLTAMDPMAYAAPTFTNPVAKQFIKKLSDPSTQPNQRNKMLQMVSSPYMFNMLGNPAFADPQLWSGLVSGAAVPYPMRNVIFGQRTGLPSQLARTGSATTTTDEFAMNSYENAASNNNGIPSPDHATRHALFHVLQHLQRKVKQHTTKLKPTPHDDSMIGRFGLDADSLDANDQEVENE